MDRNLVPERHRPQEAHPVHRDGHGPAPHDLRREESACEIHLPHQPAAEDVAIWIGVSGHGGHPDGEGMDRRPEH